MGETTYIDKSVLLELLQTIIQSISINKQYDKKFITELKQIVTSIWISISQNKVKDTDSWLLYSRVGVIGLHAIISNKEKFNSILNSLLLKEYGNSKTVFVPDIDMYLSIQNTETFIISVCYGLVNFLAVKKQLHSDINMHSLYNILYQGCLKQTRHNLLYYQLLLQLVQNFSHVLTPERCDRILYLVYYNLDKKESSTFLALIFDRTETTHVQNIFKTLVKTVSWKYKYKFILLNEIITHRSNVVHQIDHASFAKALMLAQEKPYLCSIAGKLYLSIIKTIPENVWLLYYFPAIKEIILNPGEPTFCHKNIFKYYLATTFQVYRTCFQEIVENFMEEDNVSIFSVISLISIGVKQSLFTKNFEYTCYIRMGIDHADNLIRNTTFEVLCYAGNLAKISTLTDLKQFIILNINNADQTSREQIKKAFDHLLKRLQSQIVHLETIDLNSDLIKNTTQFFDWLVKYLLEQFSKASNYQRKTFALSLLDLILKYISKSPKIVTSKKCPEKVVQYSQLIENIKNIHNSFPHFVNMLLFTNMEQKEIVFNMIFEHISPHDIKKTEIKKLLETGKQKLCNCNVEEAESGMKLVELAIRYYNVTDSAAVNWELQNLHEMMRQQWENIKKSASTNVVAENNPLHSFISLTEELLLYYGTTDFEYLLPFLEDVVVNLLNVFELRTMLPFSGENCTGVALTFMDHDSDYYACTVNCMWFVLKASCKLASKMTKILKTDDFMARTLDIIFSVVQRCYHKGALEIAGATLADIVATATATGHNVSVIEQNMRKILEKIPETTEANSTVRRAAETRISLSMIAVNDKRFNKPLFHSTMSFMLQILEDCVLCMESNPNDAVHALVLHCLRPLIMENVVETHAVEYVADVTINCLKSFESHKWEVRNAALQTFGAVTNKLLGPNLSNTDSLCQEHAVCLEEVFYRHPKILSYFVCQLDTANNFHGSKKKIMTHILSFIAMSYRRINEFSCYETQLQIDNLLQYIKDYVPANSHEFTLVARAYTAMCFHKDFEQEIDYLVANVLDSKYVDDNQFFIAMFSIRVLSEKLLDDAKTLPFDTDIEKKINAKFDTILSSMKQTKLSKCAVFSDLLLYRHGLQSIEPSDIEFCLTYLYNNEDFALNIPGLLIWTERILIEVLSFAKIESLTHLINECLSENSPSYVKATCFNTIRNRIAKNKTDKYDFDKQLCNILIKFLYANNNNEMKYVSEQCVKLVLCLEMKYLENGLVAKLMSDINGIEEKFPLHFIPMYCLVYELYCSSHENIRNFFRKCIEICAKSLEDDSLNYILLRSVFFISKYAKRIEDMELMVSSLKTCLNMLQFGDEKLNAECCKIVALCFDRQETHPFGSVLNLINPDYLSQLLGVFHAFQFLVFVYTDQDDEECVGINVFKQKPILSLETRIIMENIHKNITYLIDKMTLYDRVQSRKWYLDVVATSVHNVHFETIKKLILNM